MSKITISLLLLLCIITIASVGGCSGSGGGVGHEVDPDEALKTFDDAE